MKNRQRLAMAIGFAAFAMLIASVTSGGATDPDISTDLELSLPRVTLDRVFVFNDVVIRFNADGTFSLLSAEGDNTVTTRTILSGAQEVPAVETQGGGSGVLSVNVQTGAIEGTVLIQGLGDVTAAHIHAGAFDENGPVIIPLIGDVNIRAIPRGTQLTGELLADFLAGRLYINVHTVKVPSGEIRGQISPQLVERSVTQLSGDQEVPSVNSSGAGLGILGVNFHTREISGFVKIEGLLEVSAAHIHLGAADENGPVIITLEGDNQARKVPDGTVLTISQLSSYLKGQLYFNVHTPANPSGELRGQILPTLR